MEDDWEHIVGRLGNDQGTNVFLGHAGEIIGEGAGNYRILLSDDWKIVRNDWETLSWFFCKLLGILWK